MLTFIGPWLNYCAIVQNAACTINVATSNSHKRCIYIFICTYTCVRTVQIVCGTRLGLTLYVTSNSYRVAVYLTYVRSTFHGVTPCNPTIKRLITSLYIIEYRWTHIFTDTYTYTYINIYFIVFH